MQPETSNLLTSAARLYREGNHEAARALVDVILSTEPDNAPAWALHARLARSPQEAVESLIRVLELDPGNEWAERQLGKFKPSETEAGPGGTSTHRYSRRELIIRAGVGVGIIAIALVIGWLFVTGLLPSPAFSEPLPIRVDNVIEATPPVIFPSATQPLPTIAVATPTDRPTQTPAPPTVTRPPNSGDTSVPDYSRLEADLRAYADLRNFYLGISFIDIQTNQRVHIDGDSRYYGLSTFKGPLVVYYLWLIEQGEIDEDPDAVEHIEPMLRWSSNTDTTCIFKRVGGIAPFNDWLADQGLDPAYNFVYTWLSWPCVEGGIRYVPEPDYRFRSGDSILGVPGNRQVLQCPNEDIPCDKAFAPNALADFYARLYQGDILSDESLSRWLGWMEKDREISYFMDDLDFDEPLQVFTKNGFSPADLNNRMNFYHEAGIVTTERGAYVLAVFTQGNPDFPGGWAIADVNGIVYFHFMREHLGG